MARSRNRNRSQRVSRRRVQTRRNSRRNQQSRSQSRRRSRSQSRNRNARRSRRVSRRSSRGGASCAMHTELIEVEQNKVDDTFITLLKNYIAKNEITTNHDGINYNIKSATPLSTDRFDLYEGATVIGSNIKFGQQHPIVSKRKKTWTYKDYTKSEFTIPVLTQGGDYTSDPPLDIKFTIKYDKNGQQIKDDDECIEKPKIVLAELS